MNNNPFFALTYGLFIVTAREADKDNGCITNTVIQVTDTPKRISVTINKNNYTHGMILRTGKLNVSVLDEEASFNTFKHWGFQSGANVDKAVGITYMRADNGVIYLTEGVNAVFCAEVTSTIDLGTHTTFICEVTESRMLNSCPSATYTYYQQHIKPQPAAAKKKGWVCTVCGYIYEGEQLPDDYLCPLCHHPASDFKPLT